MNLAKFIVPTKLDNTYEHILTDYEFSTEDLIYLDSWDEIKRIPVDRRITYPTDYAIMNSGGILKRDSLKRKPYWIWLRSAKEGNRAGMLWGNGDESDMLVTNSQLGLCPVLHLNLSYVISARRASRDNFRISEIKTKGLDNYHTIEFGEYPKSYVGDSENEKLEKLYFSGGLRSTGKTYTGRMNDCEELIIHSEFEYEGKKCVRVLLENKFSGETNETYMWAKVEPIVWKIRNWQELPKELNPSGSGKASYIYIRTEEAIISGLPFHPCTFSINGYRSSLWQNSTIRGYLNGYNVNNITSNGNKWFAAPFGGDFRERNFLYEALSREISLVSSSSAEKDNNYKARRELDYRTTELKSDDFEFTM